MFSCRALNWRRNYLLSLTKDKNCVQIIQRTHLLNTRKSKGLVLAVSSKLINNTSLVLWFGSTVEDLWCANWAIKKGGMIKSFKKQSESTFCVWRKWVLQKIGHVYIRWAVIRTQPQKCDLQDLQGFDSKNTKMAHIVHSCPKAICRCCFKWETIKLLKNGNFHDILSDKRTYV